MHARKNYASLLMLYSLHDIDSENNQENLTETPVNICKVETKKKTHQKYIWFYLFDGVCMYNKGKFSVTGT